jgi:hypothetical protein
MASVLDAGPEVVDRMPTKVQAEGPMCMVDYGFVRLIYPRDALSRATSSI